MKGFVNPSGDKVLRLEEMYAYIQGKMTEAEIAEIEQLLAKDPLQAKAMERLSQEWHDASPEQRAKLPARAHRMEDTFLEESRRLGQKKADNPAAIPKPSIWNMAAIILVLLLPLAYFGLRPPLEERLEGQYFTALEANNVRGGLKKGGSSDGPNIEEQFSLVMAYYKQASQKNLEGPKTREYYQAAIDGFQEILSLPPDNLPRHVWIPSQMYLGVSYLMVETPKLAIPHFQAIIDQEDNLYVAAAHWYKGWGLLQQGDRDGAISEFQFLSEIPNTYRSDATELVKKLQ